MDQNRKIWNDQQKSLRQALNNPVNHLQAIELFLSQHAMVHAVEMSDLGSWSFADEVWHGLTEEDIRQIPSDGEHSIAWIYWHMTRIEDVTMNMLISGTPQLLDQDDWLIRLGLAYRDTGNAMDHIQIATLSVEINITALHAYRITVGRKTREIVNHIQPNEFNIMVDASRLKLVLEEGAVVDGARGLLDYWGSLTIAGLLLMPPTRHNFIHLNEARRVKQTLLRKKGQRGR
jgi:hypothetical protein